MVQAIIHNQLSAAFISEAADRREKRGENLHEVIIESPVIVESPVRVDLAGGWSDTPPICFEHAAAVNNSLALPSVFNHIRFLMLRLMLMTVSPYV